MIYYNHAIIEKVIKKENMSPSSTDNKKIPLINKNKIENLVRVKDVLWPHMFLSIIIGTIITEILYKNDENRTIIQMSLCLVPGLLMCYLRRYSSSFGLFISTDIIFYKNRSIAKTIRWENLYIETILDTNLPYPRKKYYFRDIKNPASDFKYEMSHPTIKRFKKMLLQYFGKDHEIFKQL